MTQAIAALRFAPLVPLWLLASLAALCLFGVALALLRRARGAGWRALCLALLIAWLAGPLVVRETREGLPDIGLLVVDRSASMQVGDRAALAERARAAITAEAGRIPDLQLRTVTVPEAGSDGTRLFATIARALADIPRARLAGIVVVTDGMVHDVPQNPPGGAPLDVLLTARGEETDRRLRVIEAPGYGIVGKSVNLVVAVEDLGVAHPEGAAKLTIRRDGQVTGVESVPIGAPQSIAIPITRAGPTVVELSTEALPGEVSTINDRAVVTINGVRDRLRVLLVSGEPHAGERTWRRLLKADPSVDLVHFTILRPPDKDDLTPLNELALIAFPVRELFQVKIKEFDLIILDRFQNRGILPTVYLRNIADYVRDGGALLMSVGPEFAGPTGLAGTPLGAILPAHLPDEDGDATAAVIDGPFRPTVTSLGTRHPVTENLPGFDADGPPHWGEWYRRIAAADVTGQVVMSAPTPNGGQAPLLVLDHVGRGRVALLLSDQIWLWSRGHDGGGPQAELLRRIAHWLMKEPELEEQALDARIVDGRLLVDRRTLDAADGVGPSVTVTDPEGRVTQATLIRSGPGRAGMSMAATLPGVWRISDGTRTAYAAATETNPREFADLRATATVLGPLARASGGGVHWLVPDGAPALRMVEPGRAASGAGWIGLRRNHDHLVTGIAALPLLPAWLALPLLLGLALLAWRREAA